MKRITVALSQLMVLAPELLNLSNRPCEDR
jgi:hypothetical protein